MAPCVSPSPSECHGACLIRGAIFGQPAVRSGPNSHPSPPDLAVAPSVVPVFLTAPCPGACAHSPQRTYAKREAPRKESNAGSLALVGIKCLSFQ